MEKFSPQVGFPGSRKLRFHYGASEPRIAAAFIPYQVFPPQVGFEPTTNSLTASCSTTELLRRENLVFGTTDPGSRA